MSMSRYGVLFLWKSSLSPTLPPRTLIAASAEMLHFPPIQIKIPPFFHGVEDTIQIIYPEKQLHEIRTHLPSLDITLPLYLQALTWTSSIFLIPSSSATIDYFKSLVEGICQNRTSYRICYSKQNAKSTNSRYPYRQQAWLSEIPHNRYKLESPQ